VTWEGTPRPAERVAAILNYRLSGRAVRPIVEALYATFYYSNSDKLFAAKSPSQSPYPAELNNFERIHCGHNPFLYARRVSQVRMEEGKLVWVEPRSEAEIRQELKALGLLR